MKASVETQLKSAIAARCRQKDGSVSIVFDNVLPQREQATRIRVTISDDKSSIPRHFCIRRVFDLTKNVHLYLGERCFTLFSTRMMNREKRYAS